MRVLVTGGSGYLGAAIVRALAREGHTPIVFARRARGCGLPAHLIDGDVCSREQVELAAKDVDAICHSAALVSLWRPRREEFDAVNIGGLQNVLEACRSHGIERLIYTSSFLALPPAGRTAPLLANDYQRTKVAGREIVRQAVARGLPVVTLVPGVVYGPGPVTEGNLVGRLVRDQLQGRLPGIIGGKRTWSFTYIDDVAAAHVGALTRGEPGSEHLVGGENLPQMRLFEMLRDMKGTRVPRTVPFPVARLAGWLEEAKARLLGRPPLLTAGTVEIFRHDWPVDGRAAREALGHPLTSLGGGLTSTLEALARDGHFP
jgi:farnesol dehydrogenase